MKGSSINVNQTVHLTGYGDYALSSIEILENPFEEKSKVITMTDENGVIFKQKCEIPEKISLFADKSSNCIKEELLNKNENLIEIEEITDKNKKNEGIEEEKIEEEVDIVGQIEKEGSDVSFEENEAIATNMEEEK